MKASSTNPMDRLITSGGELILTKSGSTLSLTPTSGTTVNFVNASITDMQGDSWTHTDDMYISITNASDKTLTVRNQGAGDAHLTLTSGNLTLSSGSINVSDNIQTGGTTRINNAGALSNITGVTFTDADQTLQLTSASHRTIAYSNAGAGTLSISTDGKIKSKADNQGFYTGAEDDFRIYHNGSNNYIDSLSTDLIINVESGTISNYYQSSTVYDPDDSYVALYSFSTSSRSLVIGGNSDEIITTMYGNLNLQSGVLKTGNTERLNSSGALSNITGFTFTSADQTIGLDSISDRTITFANSGAGDLKLKLNSSLVARKVYSDDTETTHTTDTPTSVKECIYFCDSNINMTPTYMVVMLEMKSGASGESVSADIYIDSNNRIQFSSDSDTYETKSNVYTMASADYSNGKHTIELYLDDDGNTSVSNKGLEIYLI